MAFTVRPVKECKSLHHWSCYSTAPVAKAEGDCAATDQGIWYLPQR